MFPVFSLFKIAVGDTELVYSTLAQSSCNGACCSAGTDEQNISAHNIKPVPIAACDKPSTIKIITMHCSVIIKPNRIDRPCQLGGGAKAVAKISKQHFMRDRHGKPTKIWYGAKRVNDEFQLFGRRIDWHHDMGQPRRRKTRVKNHWRPNMINRMGDHAKDARCPFNPWHQV